MTDNLPDEPESDLSSLQDRALVDLALSADSRRQRHRAFEQLVGRYRDGLLRLLKTKFGLSPEAAEDELQDALRMAWKHLHRWDPERSRVSSWLYQIVKNRGKNTLRTRSRNREIHVSDAEGEDPERGIFETTPEEERTPEERAAFRRLEEKVEEGIASLPAHQKLPALLRWEGHDYQTIADVTGVGLGTTKSRLARAREGLKVKLSRAGVNLSEYLQMKD